MSTAEHDMTTSSGTRRGNFDQQQLDDDEMADRQCVLYYNPGVVVIGIVGIGTVVIGTVVIGTVDDPSSVCSLLEPRCSSYLYCSYWCSSYWYSSCWYTSYWYSSYWYSRGSTASVFSTTTLVWYLLVQWLLV